MGGAFLQPRGTTVEIDLPQQGDSEPPLTTVDENTELLKEILVELRRNNEILMEVHDLRMSYKDMKYFFTIF